MRKLLIFGMMITAVTLSCKKKGCTDVKALNYDPKAEKKDLTCRYPMGINRDPFLGNYQVVDSMYIAGVFSEGKAYTIQVTTGGTVRDTILLNNLYDSGKSFIAVLTGNGFSVPSQQVNGSYYAGGSGAFYSGNIILQTQGDDTVNKIESAE